MNRISKAKVLADYRIDLTFEDGTQGVVDLANLAGRGVFSLWDDYTEFKKVQIGDAGELIWADQLDLCPDSLYMQVTGKKPEDVFPVLTNALADA